MSEPEKKILCVEDDKDSREMLKALLRQSNSNYAVTAVGTAAEALELSRRESFDLFVLDIWLPGMDGVDLCRRLRDRGITTPIIFLSAMGVRPTDREFVLAAGANAFLIKASDLDKLTSTAANLLDGQPAAAVED